MPTYDYACPHCGPFDMLRAMAQRDAPAFCPHCGQGAERVLIHAPTLATMSAVQRLASSTNERASHEPQSSKSYVPKRHPSGCSCCSGGKSKATAVAPNGNKAFPSKRPWMISH